jgi:hypothetical protein
MQDKWSSLIHGRPSHIFSANWAVQPLLDEDSGVDSLANSNIATATEDEIADLARGQVLFGQMISLTAIMAEIMDTFYTQVAIQDFANAGTKSTRMILERAKPVQIKLKDWFGKLPPSLRMDDVQKGKLSPTG